METLLNHPVATNLGIIGISLAARYGAVLLNKRFVNNLQKRGYRTGLEETDNQTFYEILTGFAPAFIGLTLLIGTVIGEMKQNDTAKILAIPGFFHLGEAVLPYFYSVYKRYKK